MTPHLPPPHPDEQTAIKRATRKLRLPMVSGRGSVLVLFLCFLVAAAMTMTLGTFVRLPIWIDFEIMLAGWWLVWIFALAHFLYHGKRVSDDHAISAPRNWFQRKPTPPGSARSSGSGWGWDLVGFGGAEEGCLWVVAILAAIIVLILVAWLLVEIIVPVLTIILYTLIRGMLARIANDRHGCTGRFAAAFFWGTVWATVYTAPLALMVWVVHLMVAQKGSG